MRPLVLVAMVAVVPPPATARASELSSNVTVCVPAGLERRLVGLEERLPGLHILNGRVGDLRPRAAACDAVVGFFEREAVELARAGGKVRWVQVASAGVEAYLAAPELRDSEIVLTNAKIIQGPEIADHAFALLLALTRDIGFFREQMSKGFERRWRLPLVELDGRTALVIGLGGIGTQVAQRAAAFGMRVLAVDPKDIPFSRDVDRVVKPDQIEGLLPLADVVFVCAPRTPESEGMLGAKQLGLLRDGAYLINVSRGAIVDTAALLAALESGKLAGAGLDVTEPEPLPADHPLWKRDDVIITPHVAGRSEGFDERRVYLFRENIERFVRGQPLRNVVDKQHGY